MVSWLSVRDFWWISRVNLKFLNIQLSSAFVLLPSFALLASASLLCFAFLLLAKFSWDYRCHRWRIPSPDLPFFVCSLAFFLLSSLFLPPFSALLLLSLAPLGLVAPVYFCLHLCLPLPLLLPDFFFPSPPSASSLLGLCISSLLAVLVSLLAFNVTHFLIVRRLIEFAI